MFGLKKDDNQKGGTPETVFDLEEQLKDPKQVEETKKHLEECISTLKGHLREGQQPEDFEGVGTLLHGYWSGMKIIDRMASGKKS